MKKKILLVAALFAGLGAVQAQEGLQLGLRAGYSFPTPGNVFSDSYQNVTKDASGNVTTEVSKGTLGTAIPLTLEGRYMFNENVGVQLDLTYSLGVNKEIATNKAPGVDVVVKGKSDQFRLAPQLVVKSNNVYSRLGVLLPVAGSTTVETNATSPLGETNQIVKVTGRPTLGFIGAIGYEFDLSENMVFFGELEALHLNITGNKYEVTDSSLDGTTIDANLIELDMVDIVEDPTKEILTVSNNYSSFGINIGVRVNF
jgi:hypothetical protein